MPLVRVFSLVLVIAGIAAIGFVTLDGDEPDADDVATAVLSDEGSTTTPDALEPLPVLGTVDMLTDLDGWLNTEYTSFEAIRADHEVVVVQFWTFACRNCRNTLEAMAAIHEEYADQGVAVVGVHSPEFAFEAEIPAIVDAAEELGVVWPIALDTTKENFHRWQEGRWGYWPRAYLIDSEGRIRQNERGDGLAGYRELAQNIERLLDGEA